MYTHGCAPCGSRILHLRAPRRAPKERVSWPVSAFLGCAGHPHAHPRDKRSDAAWVILMRNPTPHTYSYHSWSERTSSTTSLFGLSPVAFASALASDVANILATWMLVISGMP